MKVAIVIPYFGKWPEWFDIYLYSCSKNPFVNFLYFTDCKVPEKIYKNTIFYPISYEEYCLRVSKELKIEFKPYNAYKLCDLKPFYGILHEKELKEYDFWGFADIDLFYGDLSIVVNDNMLKKHKVITCHADRISGHFTIFRKCDKLSLIGYKIKNWKSKLESQNHYGLDEVDLTQLLYPSLKNILRLYKYIVNPLLKIKCHAYLNFVNSWYSYLTKYSFKEYYTTPIPSENEIWIYTLKTGEIYSPYKKKLPYLHFLFYKKTPYYQTDIYWKDNFYKIEQIDINRTILINNKEISYSD